MKLWMRKIFVILMAVFTLGIYVPPIIPDADAAEQKDVASNPEDNGSAIEVAEIDDNQIITDVDIDYTDILTKKAQEQTMVKLGPRIIPQIEDEFTTNILPVMEQVISSVIATAEKDDVPYYAISENPASGVGERIFNVIDERSKEDIAKFHVRRVNRPKEGFWFNFHYHLSDDDFEKHYDIGEIYWDKNIPPQWMA